MEGLPHVYISIFSAKSNETTIAIDKQWKLIVLLRVASD